jgi:hypothetical protein
LYISLFESYFATNKAPYSEVATTLIITTLSIMTLHITTLRKMTLHKDTQHRGIICDNQPK